LIRSTILLFCCLQEIACNFVEFGKSFANRGRALERLEGFIRVIRFDAIRVHFDLAEP